MDKSLSARHAKRIPAVLRSRGADYHRWGKVKLKDVTEDLATATVSGSMPYRVTIRNFQSAAAVWTCTCPYFEDASVCKHIWATLLSLEHLLGGLEAAGAGAPADHALEQVVGLQDTDLDPFDDDEDDDDDPFADDDDDFEDDDEDDDEEGADAGPWQRVPRPSSAPLHVEPWSPTGRSQHLRLVGGDGPSWFDARPWRDRLTPPSDTYRKAPPPLPAAIEYFLEHRAYAAGFLLCVRTRTRGANGQPGARKTTAIRQEQLRRLPEPHRTLLGYYSQQVERVRRGSSWSPPLQLEQDELRLLLPLLAATGSVFVGPVPDSAQAATPLQFDHQEPFTVQVELKETATKGRQRPKIALALELQRGDERLEVPGAWIGHEFLIAAPRFVRVDWCGAESLARDLRHAPLVVNAAEREELIGALVAHPAAHRILGPLLAEVPLGVPAGVLTLRVPGGANPVIPASLGFDYGGIHVPRDAEAPVVEASPLCRRDAAAEAAIVEKVTGVGMTAGADGSFQIERERLSAVVSTLLAAAVRVVAEGKPLRPFAGATGALHTGIDWFEVRAQLQFEGRSFELPELLRAKAIGAGLFELGDGSIGMLPEAWAERIDRLRGLGGEVEGNAIRLPSTQGLLLDAMLSATDDSITVDRKFAALRARWQSFTSLQPRPEPAGFQGQLRPYQRQGLGWLHFLREFSLGGCLADDMGLGKTVQVLALLQEVHGGVRRKNARPSLLVAPRSVLGNWLAEAARFSPSLRVLDFSGPDRWQALGVEAIGAHDLVLTTYALLRQDAPRFVEHELAFEYAILDESQMAKNADTQTSKGARLLRAAHRLALSGTPVENHLGELWSLFEFLNPGMLGRLPAFRALFGSEVAVEGLNQNRELVQRALRPVLLRRTKAQVLTDLPEKVEQTLWCELEPANRRRYDRLREHYRKLLLEGPQLDHKQRFVALEALLRLRQAACHEGLLDPRLHDAASAKLDALLPQLSELTDEGHKVLVFSQFTTFLDLVEPRLRAAGIRFERLDGSTRDRAARVERFQQDAAVQVFLISLKAGGFGLNLTAADYVFVLDPWWNPAAEMQAIDRAHRIGQKRVVHAYRLVCKDTVEERVLELQQQKKALCEAILGNERSLLQDLTREDLAMLLA
ncbi:MAG: DEAD/DEAH box helicase [Planctomycetes bacterium]|nr:DEAD/DEAH box helicase [Planctomycetota bacterium]